MAVVEVGRHSDYCIFDSFSEVGLCGFLHFGEDHGRYFFWVEPFGLSLVLDHNNWFVVDPSFDLEWPVLHIFLHNFVIEFPADESLGIEHSIVRILGHLVLGCVSNESFSFGEANIGWSGSVSLIVGYDLHPIVLPHSHTGVGRS